MIMKNKTLWKKKKKKGSMHRIGFVCLCGSVASMREIQ